MNDDNKPGNKENVKYRNSIFVDLFYEDETADENDIALYNALHQEQLPENVTIRRFRVADVMYMNFKNDMSFGVEDRILVFGEHQSTINQNMPLRSLMYIGRAYEQLVPVKSRYKKALVQLPAPEFYTFYNGKEEYAGETMQKLSDAYKEPAAENSLELKVKVINIKEPQKHEVLQHCKILREYAQFVECVEQHRSADEENAIEQAIKECIKKNILKEYLLRKGSQVINMLIAEYDYATDIEVQRDEARTEGRTEGEYIKLISLVRKKMVKGMSSEECAELLEEDIELVKAIYDQIEAYPTMNDEKICKKILETDKRK